MSRNQRGGPTRRIGSFATSPRNANKGFTLIEISVVVILTGIIASTAIPRFIDLTGSAHKSNVESTAGAFQEAINLAYIGCVTADFAGQDNLPNFGSGNLDFNANCYPSSTNGRNGNVNRRRCRQVWNGILSLAPSVDFGANGSADYRSQGSGTTCTFTYRNDPDTTRSFTYSTANGVIALSNP